MARAPLAVVDPRRLGPRVAAAHVEVSHLSDPAEEQRLRAPAYVATLGRAIAAAIDQAVVEAPPAAVDVWHEVPLVPQVTACSVDRVPRKWPKPSDHAPVVLTLA